MVVLCKYSRAFLIMLLSSDDYKPPDTHFELIYLQQRDKIQN